MARDGDSTRAAGEDSGSRRAVTPKGEAQSRKLPRWKLALWVAPYVLVLYLVSSVSAVLVLPGAAICAGTFILYERLHPGEMTRFPAGWMVALLLQVPSGYLYSHGLLWLLPLVIVPALLFYALHRATRGKLGRWWRRNPPNGSLLYLVAVAALFLGSVGRFGLPPFSDDVLFGLYAAPHSISLTQEEMEAAIQVVDAALVGYPRAADDEVPETVRALVEQLPSGLADRRGRSVHVTLWLDRYPLARGEADTGALYERLSRATVRALDEVQASERWVQKADQVRIQVDVADAPVEIRFRAGHRLVMAAARWLPQFKPLKVGAAGLLYQLVHEIEPGVDGMQLRAGSRSATFLPADPVLRGWLTPRVKGRAQKTLRLVRMLSAQAHGDPNLWSESGTLLFKFRTFSFGRPVPRQRGGRVVRLFRGNVLVDAVGSREILDGIAAAGEWLLRTVRRDGKFDYEYFPNQDGRSADYNIVRHAGSVYGLLHMYNLALREPELRPRANAYLEAAVRSLSWVHKNLATPRGATDPRLLALVDVRGTASSGAAALTLLSLLERPPARQVSHPVLRRVLARPDDSRSLEGLGLFLLAMTDERGRVFGTYREALRSSSVEKEPLYYPGESMLALAVLHRATGDPRWLAGSRKIADWQVETYQRRRQNPDHWVMQALWELYDITGEERYARAGLQMGDHYAREQYPPHAPPFPDYLGSYRRLDDTPRTTRACSRSEAMGGVVHTAWKRLTDAVVYEDALLNAARHLLENQWRPENSYYLPRPDRARGAIRMGLVDNHCRIDNNQHAIVGLHRALQVSRKREGAKASARMVLPAVPDEDEIRACRVRFGEPLEVVRVEPPAAGSAALAAPTAPPPGAPSAR